MEAPGQPRCLPVPVALPAGGQLVGGRFFYHRIKQRDSLASRAVTHATFRRQGPTGASAAVQRINCFPDHHFLFSRHGIPSLKCPDQRGRLVGVASDRNHPCADLQIVQIIGPCLHHLLAFGKVGGPVIRSAVRVFDSMGQLMFDEVRPKP